MFFERGKILLQKRESSGDSLSGKSSIDRIVSVIYMGFMVSIGFEDK